MRVAALLLALLVVLVVPAPARDLHPFHFVNVDNAGLWTAPCPGGEVVWDNASPAPVWVAGLQGWTRHAWLNLRIGGFGYERESGGDRYFFFHGFPTDGAINVAFPGRGIRVAPRQRLIAQYGCVGDSGSTAYLFVLLATE